MQRGDWGHVLRHRWNAKTRRVIGSRRGSNQQRAEAQPLAAAGGDVPWLVLSPFEVHHAGIALSTWVAPLAVLAECLTTSSHFATG